MSCSSHPRYGPCSAYHNFPDFNSIKQQVSYINREAPPEVTSFTLPNYLVQLIAKYRTEPSNTFMCSYFRGIENNGWKYYLVSVLFWKAKNVDLSFRS
jgi:hypothetical protein